MPPACDTPIRHGHERQKHSCGYVEGTFACKIRHLQINTGAAKSDETKLVPTRGVHEV
jgi:hypothetical protein